MSQAHEMRVLLADNQAGATNAISLAARNCNLKGTEVFGRDPGKRGTRQQLKCGARVLREDVSGGFDFYPTVAQLDWLIERAIGDNITGFPGSAATPGETVPSFYAFVDKGADNFRFDELRIASLVFTIPEGDYVNCRVDFVGKDETSGVSWPGSAPAIDCDSEFAAADVSFIYGGTGYPFKNLTMSIGNTFGGSQENALKRTIFEAGDLEISLDGQFGFRTGSPDLTDLYRPGVAGAAGSVIFNDGTTIYTFSFANMKIPGDSPDVPDEGEITQALRVMCYGDTSTDQVTISKA